MRWQRRKGEAEPAKLKRRQALIGGGLAAIVAVALVAWLLIDGNDGDESSSAGAVPTEATIVSVAALRRAADAESSPIYWAGASAGTELELSGPSPDRTYVRYLTGGAKAGDPRRFLTVGSYRYPDAAAVLQDRSNEPGGILAKAPGDGTVYFDQADPKSVYLAYPNTEVEIEVFAPKFKEALQLVTDGRIVPVE
jgi:hypothetical protein